MFTPATGTLTISEVIVKSSSAAKSNEGEALYTGHSTLQQAFDAINDGTHTGEIIIYIYTNTTETETATLNRSGEGGASYTSVSIIAMDNVQLEGAAPLINID